MINPPVRIDERSQLINRMVELQKLIAEIRAEAPLAKSAFDGQWKELSSDWDYLSQACSWLEENGALRFVAAKLTDKIETAHIARETHLFSQKIVNELEQIATELKGTIGTPLGSSSDKLMIALCARNFKHGLRIQNNFLNGLRISIVLRRLENMDYLEVVKNSLVEIFR